MSRGGGVPALLGSFLPPWKNSTISCGPPPSEQPSQEQSAAVVEDAAVPDCKGAPSTDDVMAAFSRGDIDRAVEWLEALLSTAKGRTAQNYFLLGEAHRHSGEALTALEQYQVALGMAVESSLISAIRYSRGLCFMAIEEWYAAVEQFESTRPNDLPIEVSLHACHSAFTTS